MIDYQLNKSICVVRLKTHIIISIKCLFADYGC